MRITIYTINNSIRLVFTSTIIDIQSDHGISWELISPICYAILWTVFY